MQRSGKYPYRSLAKSFLLAALVPAIAGCAFLYPAPVPLGRLSLGESAPPGRSLIVFLPGLNGSARDFLQHDFVGPLAEMAPECDAVAVDATIGYYVRLTLAKRLHDDVIGPARARGYRRIWLVGISMGGLGAVLYDELGPGDVDGILLLSPYLGDQEVTDEIRNAGGVAGWRPPKRLDPNDFQRKLWAWLKQETESRPKRARIYLGYPTEDPFVQGHRLLAGRLPAGQVFTTGGGHDWLPWETLWRKFLASGALERE